MLLYSLGAKLDKNYKNTKEKRSVPILFVGPAARKFGSCIWAGRKRRNGRRFAKNLADGCVYFGQLKLSFFPFLKLNCLL